MTDEIHTVKREIRILGMDACRHRATVGAIVRGGSYLDGIMTFPETNGGKLAERIRESRYYPELRVIMLHDPKHQLNGQQLWRETGLPIIEITKTVLRHSHNYTRFEKKNEIVYARSTLKRRMLRQVINLSWTIDDLPEPVRVAHLLINSISSWPLSR